jgi:Patatin-like phospholipase.
MPAKLLVLLFALLLSACAVKRESLPLAACQLATEPVTVDIPGYRPGLAAPQAGNLSPYSDALAQRLATAALARSLSQPQSTDGVTEIRQLILSGGGEWGSFGTGFFHGWARRQSDTLPRFDGVTGVSTGALQATFAFLGREPPKADRSFPTKEDFPAGWSTSADRRFDVDDLVAGYSITRPDTLYRDRGTMGIIRRAAMGDLDPLARRMKYLVTRDTLMAVKREGADNRVLKVALVNWDTGQAVAVDMTALAAQLRDDSANLEAVQHCYIQVLLAASSETLGMPPVRIGELGLDPKRDNNKREALYFDAGVRFGVFADDTRAAGRRAAQIVETQTRQPTRAVTYIIANNDLAVLPSRSDERAKWNLLDLAGRGRHILVNQVYLFSVERIFAAKDSPTEQVRFAYVRASDIEPCEKDRAEDEKTWGKKSFHPQFMKCLMRKGEERAGAWDWDH